jgi:preprotein translocase subunit SecG
MSSTFLTLANILYVLVSVAMIVMILLQRGAGAAAGSGFGAGASATVFGARGAANFLSKSTAVLATLFFVISLGMAMYVARAGAPAVTEDLGVMGAAVPAEPQVPSATGSQPVATGEVPAVEVPSSAGSTEAAPAGSSVDAEATAAEADSAKVESENPPSEGGSGE